MTEKTEDLFDDEVTTGATLASGTTVGGNQAYHLGNDGQGSGLDAETVQQVKPLAKGQSYEFSEESGTFGNTTNTFTDPEFLQGMASDKNDCLWFTGESDTSIYKINQSGTAEGTFASPSGDIKGLDIDSEDSIWIASDDTYSVYELDKSASVQSSMDYVDTGGEFTIMGGVGIDKNNCLWQFDQYADDLYRFKQTSSGGTDYETSIPSNAPTGVDVSFDAFDSVWTVDINNYEIIKNNKSGSVIEKFSTPSNRNTYITHDNSYCIWMLGTDSSNSSFYEKTTGRTFTRITGTK